ncbi:hypothetical protein AVEN_258577-1 [Araneus ventricosus]|uniref:Peptidase aspartic putative domain-containing protein n=1 Tax=Araneus ventricosus TaxID=182803 RepID=A0A4Y2RP53_ARAVE|nr:hypothetical protein AVEN_258577-1 [Araneus ventricosus]
MDRAKAKRATVRQLFTKLVTKIESTIELPINERFTKVNKVECLFDLKNQLIEKIDELKKLDNEIEAVIDLNDLEGELIASDEYRKNVRSLESLGVAADTYSSLLCPIVLQKIPEEINLQYNRHRKLNELFDIKDLLKFLRKEIECRETSLLLGNQRNYVLEASVRKPFNSSNYADTKLPYSPKRNLSTAATLIATTERQNCIFCSEIHKDYECPLSSSERKGVLINQGRCFVCLGRRHTAKICWERNQLCRNCNKSHSSLICNSRNAEENCSNDLKSTETKSQTESSLLCRDDKGKPKNSVCLQTFTAGVQNRKGEILSLRCLCDGGSTRTFIKRETADFLGLKVICREELLIYAFGNRIRKRQIYDVVQLSLRNRKDPSRKIQISAVVIEDITVGEIEVPSERGGERESDCGEVHVNLLRVINEELKYDRVKDLSELEVIGLNPKKEIPHSDLEILEAFEQNVTYENNGYGMKLLWKDNHKGLNDNYEIARQRLFNLNKGFKRDENFCSKYKDINNSQLEDNIMLEVNCESKNDVSEGFMPHRGVVKELKETTKLRICYDASSKANNEMSLN